MSNYRDDNQDTAIISASTFGGMRSIAEDIIRIKDIFLFGLMTMASAAALASDDVIDNTAYIFTDTASVLDTTTGQLTARQLTYDKSRIGDSLLHTIGALASDSVTASDAILSTATGSLTHDQADVADAAYDSRTVNHLATDKARISDSLTRITTEVVTDSIGAKDSYKDKLKAKNLISLEITANDVLLGDIFFLTEESAIASDEVIAHRYVRSVSDSKAKISDSAFYNANEVIVDAVHFSDYEYNKLYAKQVISDSARIHDEVLDKIIQSNAAYDSAILSDAIQDRLNSKELLVDTAVVEDEILSAGGFLGYAWTASVDNWAMSRYEPYNYQRLVVIDDVLYGESEQGIYRLDQSDNAVTAKVKTGKMDIGKGSLVHPHSAYIEYSLQGNASMTVSTTQKGIEQQYTYLLPSEQANELTNGRFVFGRGLRGRHFGFELTMMGTHGHINDLSVEHAPTSRRV